VNPSWALAARWARNSAAAGDSQPDLHRFPNGAIGTEGERTRGDAHVEQLLGGAPGTGILFPEEYDRSCDRDTPDVTPTQRAEKGAQMRIKQGTFSTLPDLTDDEIKAQIQYCIDQGWAVSVEYTDDPHPRNIDWELWGMPMFDTQDAAACFTEVTACREAYPNHYIKVNGYNAKYTKQTIGLSFIVNRPGWTPASVSTAPR